MKKIVLNSKAVGKFHLVNKDEKNIDKVEGDWENVTAHNVWFFMQYYKESNYPHFPFEIKMFFNFDDMKTYSAIQSSFYKERFPSYCSDYVKSEMYF